MAAIEVLRVDSWPAVIRPAEAPWAVRPAVWAVLAAGVVAGAGVVTGDLVATGLAYFGVACSAVLVTWGVYRGRVISLSTQTAGAIIGIVLGVAVADSVPAKVALAAAVAMVSGMIGAIGFMSTAGALMAVIGVAFGEFARVRLPGWEQGLWYLIGTLTFSVFALAGWPAQRDRAAWDAVAAVFDRSATLIERIGQDDASKARLELAAASAASRTEVFDHRVRYHFGALGPAQRLLLASNAADQVALAAAGFFAAGRSPADADAVVSGVRQAAGEARNRRVPTVPPALASAALVTRLVRPPRARARSALRSATARPALVSGLRLAVCMTVATATTCALHSESHSFWLPLTVAVAVRPEYGSVFVRTTNRVCGTVAGAFLAAGAIAVLGSGWPAAGAAALSLGFAALARPRLYGLSVVGVTCSALLSSCIGSADPINPAVRLLDTLVGCAIAIVFGYLLWPGRRQAPVEMTETADAAIAYLDQAVLAPGDRHNWSEVRDRAYELAHRSRQRTQAALLDPQPVRDQAIQVLPNALALENLVDEVTLIANRIDSGAVAPSNREATALADRIRAATRTP